MKSLIKAGKQITLEREAWVLGKRHLITLEWLFGNTNEFQDKIETTVAVWMFKKVTKIPHQKLFYNFHYPRTRDNVLLYIGNLEETAVFLDGGKCAKSNILQRLVW